MNNLNNLNFGATTPQQQPQQKQNFVPKKIKYIYILKDDIIAESKYSVLVGGSNIMKNGYAFWFYKSAIFKNEYYQDYILALAVEESDAKTYKVVNNQKNENQEYQITGNKLLEIYNRWINGISEIISDENKVVEFIATAGLKKSAQTDLYVSRLIELVEKWEKQNNTKKESAVPELPKDLEI